MDNPKGDWWAPDYPNVVKNPMDLRSIEQQLTLKRYANAEEFENDVQLVLTNCFLYNHPGTPVYKKGERLRKLSAGTGR